MHVHGHGLSIEVIWNDDLVALFLRGDLDQRSAPLLARTLDVLRDQRPGSVWVNVAGIERIDTAGAQILLEARQRARDRGCEFLIRSPSTTVGHALERVQP
jgi:anti-anti-sigma factor